MNKLPSSGKLWQKHEQLVLKIFMRALIKLRNENSIPEEERKLNERLYICVREVWRELKTNEKPIWSLGRNSENPPRTRDEIEQEWTRKKPDFQWTLSDPQEKNPVRAIREYAIECKRLRTKTISWDFIDEYVVSGIIRFLAEEYKYGNGTSSGAMIGYIQSMEYDEILKQINTVIQNQKDYDIPNIEISEKGDEIRKGNHTLNRKKVNPSIFDLRHIWVSLRN